MEIQVIMLQISNMSTKYEFAHSNPSILDTEPHCPNGVVSLNDKCFYKNHSGYHMDPRTSLA